MKIKRLFFAATLLFSGAAFAAPPVDYYVSLASPREHLLHVRIHLAGTSAERELQLPAWNALYQIRDFAQNVRSVHATDETGHPLPIHKVDKTTWRADHAESGAEVEYDVYADQPGPWGAQFTSEHAFLNLAEILMYPTDARESLMTVSFADIPKSWHIATVLPTLRPGEPSSRGLFIARNYERLVDAPIEMGNFRESSFEVSGATYRIAVHADPSDYDMQAVIATVRKIVSAGVGWMNDRPFSEYLFIFHFPRAAGSGGMEHAYSTAIDVPADRLTDDPLSLGRVSAHEFFHLWNVKRIRPASLEPVDYIHENYTRALWFSEGVTDTVADILLFRAGLMDEKQFLFSLAQQIRQLQLRPAHRTQSVEESSLDTWFDKYPQYRLPGRSISYYNKGEVLGVLLDLAIRRASRGGKSLRELFQWMNQHYAQDSRFFKDSEGVRQAAEAVTSTDFGWFFRAYVSGVNELPYDELLSTVGLKLVQRRMITPAPGFDSVRNFGSPPVIVAVQELSDAGKAGVVPGDTILQVNGRPASADVEGMIQNMHPGDSVRLKIAGRKGTRDIKIKLGGREEDDFSIVDTDHVTAAQRARRAAWLAGEAESP